MRKNYPINPFALKLYRKIKNIIHKTYENILRASLTESEFTILCPNCIGGLIYHNLGMQFQSPTINLWITQSDFVKFMVNLTDYIEKDLIFYEDPKYNHPIARCGDITIYFNHYHTEKEALDCWNKRKLRINYDKLYIIMYNINVSEEELKELEMVTCKGIILLSPKKYSGNIKTKVIKPNLDRENGEFYLDFDFCGMRTFERKWNYVKWINGNR